MCSNDPAIGVKTLKNRREPPNPKIFPHVLQNAQEMWLHWYEWFPKTCAPRDVKGVMFLVSGLGEHGMRYDGFAEELAEEMQFAVFSLDHQGHGLSEGMRKYVDKFQYYTNDYLQFLMTVFAKYGPSNKHGIDITQLPRFLLGHSMGGLIALHVAKSCAKGLIPESSLDIYFKNGGQSSAIPLLTAEKSQLYFNCLVISGPAIKPDPNVATPTKQKLAQWLANLAPTMGLGNLEITEICSNPQVIQNARDDVLFAKEPLRARWGYEMLVAMGEVQNQPKTFLNFPFLMIHGEKDTLTAPEASAEFYKQADEVEDKKYVLYLGKKHETLNEVGCEEVRTDVKAFITAHMQYHPSQTKVVDVDVAAYSTSSDKK